MAATDKGLDDITSKNNIKIVVQYHSALEHEFLWTVESENAHLVERFMIESGWAIFNAVKIVPLGTYHDPVRTCRKLENPSE